MSYFDNDFFGLLQSPLSEGGVGPPHEMKVEVTGPTSAKLTSPPLPFLAGSLSWNAREYLLDASVSLKSSGGRHGKLPTQPVDAYTTATGGDGPSDVDDMMNAMFWGFDHGETVSTVTPGDKPGSRTLSPVAAGSTGRGGSYRPVAEATRSASPWGQHVFLSSGDVAAPATGTQYSPYQSPGANEALVDAPEAPWADYMMNLGSPLTSTCPARATATAATSPAHGASSDAAEEAYFADIMPMLLECGEAMRQHQKHSSRRSSASTRGRKAAKQTFSGFRPTNFTPGHLPEPLPTECKDFTELHANDTAAALSSALQLYQTYYLLSPSDSEDDAPPQVHEAQAEWWLRDDDDRLFLSTVEADSHAVKPSTALTPADAAATSEGKDSPPQLYSPFSSPLEDALPSKPAPRGALQRPSQSGGRPTNSVRGRRTTLMATVADASSTILRGEDIEVICSSTPRRASDDSSKPVFVRVRRSPRKSSQARRSHNQPTAASSTTPEQAAASQASSPAHLRTVLVLANTAAPSSAVPGRDAFDSVAHFTSNGTLECEELALAAEGVVAGESAASVIMHGTSVCTRGASPRVTGGDSLPATTAPASQDGLSELSCFFSFFFTALARRSAQVAADTLCAQCSVVLLKQDMYRDLLQPASLDSYRTVLVSGTPLLGPRLGGAALHPLQSCARTMETLRQALSRLVGDDSTTGVVLVTVYVKQKVPYRAGAKKEVRDANTDVLLSSYSAVVGSPRALHDSVVLNLYPLTVGLVQRCFRGAILPSLLASLQEMEREERQLAIDLVAHFSTHIRSSPPHVGSVTQLLSSIHRQAKVFHGMLRTSHTQSDTARQKWKQICDEVDAKSSKASKIPKSQRRSQSGSLSSTERSQIRRAYKSYQRYHRRWLRLDFLLRSLAGIAADCEDALLSDVSVLPPVYLVTAHYLRQRPGAAGQGTTTWAEVSRGVPVSAQNVRFASDQPLYATDSEDDDERVPANTPIGKHQLSYPFSFRQPRGVQSRSVVDANIPPLVEPCSLNLFSGGYADAMLGIRALLDPTDPHLRRLFGLPALPPSEPRPSLLPCPLLTAPKHPSLRTVIWLDPRAVPGTVAEGEESLVQACAQRVDDHTVRAGPTVDCREFRCDEVCTHRDSPIHAGTPASVELSSAFSDFVEGFNTHVYYCVASEKNAPDRLDRLRRAPLWSMLEEMVFASLHTAAAAAGGRKQARAPHTARTRRRQGPHSNAAQGARTLFMSACHIVNADAVCDHFACPGAASNGDNSPSPTPRRLVPFRAAWTAAGPVVEGCQYVRVDSSDGFSTQIATVLENVEAAYRHGKDTHVRLSFLLHNCLVDAPTAPAGDVLLSSLTVWLTTNPILFVSLGVPTPVSLAHKLNLMRPHYCHSVVHVTDVPTSAIHPNVSAAALARQAELWQSMAIPQFACQWSLRAYLQYLVDRQAAFRVAAATAAKRETNPVGDCLVQGPPAADAALVRADAEPVLVGESARARDVLDACGVLERMRGAVTRAMDAAVNPSEATAAASSRSTSTLALHDPSAISPTTALNATTTLCGILALTSDGRELYGITTPPPHAHVGLMDGTSAAPVSVAPAGTTTATVSGPPSPPLPAAAAQARHGRTAPLPPSRPARPQHKRDETKTVLSSPNSPPPLPLPPARPLTRSPTPPSVHKASAPPPRLAPLPTLTTSHRNSHAAPVSAAAIGLLPRRPCPGAPAPAATDGVPEPASQCRAPLNPAAAPQPTAARVQNGGGRPKSGQASARTARGATSPTAAVSSAPSKGGSATRGAVVPPTQQTRAAVPPVATTREPIADGAVTRIRPQPAAMPDSIPHSASEPTLIRGDSAPVGAPLRDPQREQAVCVSVDDVHGNVHRHPLPLSPVCTSLEELAPKSKSRRPSLSLSLSCMCNPFTPLCASTSNL